MATTIITLDQDSIVSEIHIAAPPDRVFQALIDPRQVMIWWTSDECQIESFSLEPKRGGRWRYDSKQSALNVNGVSKFHCDGEVLEYDPPRLLAYTWIANWHEDKACRTVVRWELAPSLAERRSNSRTVDWPPCPLHARITATAGRLWSRN